MTRIIRIFADKKTNNFQNLASSTMKCNTWEAERRNAILSVYVKTIHSLNLV